MSTTAQDQVPAPAGTSSEGLLASELWCPRCLQPIPYALPACSGCGRAAPTGGRGEFELANPRHTVFQIVHRPRLPFVVAE